MVKNQNAPNFKKVKLVREQFNFKDKMQYLCNIIIMCKM